MSGRCGPASDKTDRRQGGRTKRLHSSPGQLPSGALLDQFQQLKTEKEKLQQEGQEAAGARVEGGEEEKKDAVGTEELSEPNLPIKAETGASSGRMGVKVRLELLVSVSNALSSDLIHKFSKVRRKPCRQWCLVPSKTSESADPVWLHQCSHSVAVSLLLPRPSH